MALFMNPVAQLKITDRSGGNVWMFTLPDDPYLTDVVINFDKGGKLSGFSFGVDVPYDKGIEYMKYPSPFMQYNVIEARIGYASDGIWLPWVGGFLSKGGAGLSLDADGFSGQVEVQAVAESYGFTIDKNIIRDSGRNTTGLLERLGLSMGLKTTISDGAKTELAKWGRSLEQKSLSPIDDAQAFFSEIASMSNWEGIKFLCRKWNLSFWIGPDVGVTDGGRNLFIFTEAEASKGVGQDTFSRIYAVRGGVDESKLQYPCLAWSPDGSGGIEWLTSQPDPSAHGVVAGGLDAGSGEVVVKRVAPAKQPVAINGVTTKDEPEDREDPASGIVGEVSKGDGELGDYISVPIDSGGEDELEKAAEEKQLSGNPALTGSITTIGIPDERPGNICRLAGAGDIYNGPYIVERVTHSFSSGGWEMTLNVRREGTVAKDGKQDETVEGQIEQ